MSLLAEIREALKESQDIGYVDKKSCVTQKYGFYDEHEEFGTSRNQFGRDIEFHEVDFWLAPKNDMLMLDRNSAAELEGILKRVFGPFCRKKDSIAPYDDIPMWTRPNGGMFEPEFECDLSVAEAYREQGLLYTGDFDASEPIGIRTVCGQTRTYDLSEEYKKEFEKRYWNGRKRTDVKRKRIWRHIGAHLFPSRQILQRWSEINREERKSGRYNRDIEEELGLMTSKSRGGIYCINIKRYNQVFGDNEKK